MHWEDLHSKTSTLKVLRIPNRISENKYFMYLKDKGVEAIIKQKAQI